MKETKVYVDELPKCIFCPMLVNLSNIGQSEELMCCLNRTAYCNHYSDIEKIERNFKLACPLKSLKAHDRELVRQVCEKIKEKTFGLWYFVLNEQKEYFEDNRYVLSQKDFNDILDQIQKEYEK